ncbi:MAG: DNA alkylation repair protein [Clostridiales bacterium]|nr:DNA alkylation repair protein [Clostridiales bacterium]
MYETYEECRAALFAGIDEKYNEFNNPIVNTTYKTYGVRTPVIKKLAKSVPISARDNVLNGFFNDSDPSYETVLFAGILATRKGDYEKTREYLKRLIPLFGSWAHVDCVISCLDWVDKDSFLRDFEYLLSQDGQYEVRSYIIFLFDCLTADRIDFVLDTLQKIEYGEYYVDMAAAWLLAECLVKFYDKTLPLFTNVIFPSFVHNKAIQKARESYRIPLETKNYLNTLKVKAKKNN